jgi:hypothetical protein
MACRQSLLSPKLELERIQTKGQLARRLETSLYQVLFNLSEYTMFEPRERTERTGKNICICAVVYYYHNGWLRD